MVTLSAAVFASSLPGRVAGRAAKTSKVVPDTVSASILGTAWKADNTPIPNAKLRLRSVVTGKIEAMTVANDAGQFAFNDIESGSYIVELISDSGRIIAVSHTLAVGPGETVATFVRTGTKVPWFTGFFENAAAAVSLAAASMGVTAIAPEEMQCVSPPCSIK